MKFTKMHGCGNDYVYVNAMENEVRNPEQVAVKVSDRHFGIGSDGLILICDSDVADFRMRMFNADGSEGKMCGNGVRCIAKYVYDNKLTDKTEISLETLGGIKYLKLQVEKGKVTQVTVDMGEPVLDGLLIPVMIDKNPVVSEPIMIQDQRYEMTCVSMGNPHAVVLVEDTQKFPIEQVGPFFEKNSVFPEGVNTEFVQVLSPSEINMRVWERGSAETMACGTGACASVVACFLLGVTGREVTVHLLGGDLKIRYDEESNHVFMTGPATTVFEGEIDV